MEEIKVQFYLFANQYHTEVQPWGMLPSDHKQLKCNSKLLSFSPFKRVVSHIVDYKKILEIRNFSQVIVDILNLQIEIRI
jgi:hypothetical protein